MTYYLEDEYLSNLLPLKDRRYLYYFAGWLSKIAYEPDMKGRLDSAVAGTNLCAFREEFTKKDGTSVSLIRFNDSADEGARLRCPISRRVFLVFRGSELFDPRDWWVNGHCTLQETVCGGVHGGYYKVIMESDENGLSVMDEVTDHLRSLLPLLVEDDAETEEEGEENKGISLVVTGHSLGGALGVVFGTFFELPAIQLSRVITFGGPPVGDDVFVRQLKDKTVRIVNGRDVVPLAPGETRHCGGEEVHLRTTFKCWRLWRTYFRPPITIRGIIDHAPGAYVDSMARRWGLVNGKRSWERWKKRKKKTA